jgi:apolipoprotein D and lipocalin family protein
MRTISLLTLTLLALGACAAPPVNRAETAPPLAVKSIDPPRYVGLWYEIARFPNQFEKGCDNATAQYSQRPDGKIDVLNTCLRSDGSQRSAKGAARIVDPATNAKLKVSFFGPFEGDYWVIDRADDYSWALVGEPSGRYLWILARTQKIDDDLRGDLLKRLASRGYNTAALTWNGK